MIKLKDGFVLCLISLVVIVLFITQVFPQNGETSEEPLDDNNPGNYIIDSLIEWVINNIVVKSEQIVIKDFTHVEKLDDIGENYLLIGNWDKALTIYNTINNLAKANQDSIWQIISIKKIALINHRIYKYDEAISLYNDVLNMVGNEDISNRIEILASIGNVYNLKNDTISALEYFNNALELVNDTNQSIKPAIIAYLYNHYAKTLISEGKLTEAMEYLDLALDNSNPLTRNDIIYSDIINNKGLIYYLKGDYPKSIEYFSNAIILNIRRLNLIRLVENYENMGYSKFLNEKYPQAIEDFQNSLRISKKIKDKYKIADSYNNIGMVKFHQNQFDDSIKFYNMAIKIGKQINNKSEDLAKYYVNLSLVYQKRGNYKLAIEKLSKAVEIEEIIDSSYYIRDKKLLEELKSIYGND